MASKKGRCTWAESSELMQEYHDTEWGVPSHDDAYLFELLLLEGAQAGLSWSTVLNKRENYRKALNGFDVIKVAKYNDAKFAELMDNPGIVRNRLKVASTAINARAFIAVQKEFGSFADYLWSWVDGKAVDNKLTATSVGFTRTELSDALSKDLKKRGFKFVGTTIIYAYLQAVGVINDHVSTCSSKRRLK